jgi:hypothetical protein
MNTLSLNTWGRLGGLCLLATCTAWPAAAQTPPTQLPSQPAIQPATPPATVPATAAAAAPAAPVPTAPAAPAATPQRAAPVPPPGATESPACREALAALQAEEARGGRAGVQPAPGTPASQPSPGTPGAQPPSGSAADAGARTARLQVLRDRASRACLGGPAAGRPAPALQTPQAVAPVSRPAAPPPVRAPLASPPAPPVVATPTPGAGLPQTVVACDSTGCTASDGSRLNKVGPDLVGPKGACTLQGAVLRCPQ